MKNGNGVARRRDFLKQVGTFGLGAGIGTAMQASAAPTSAKEAAASRPRRPWVLVTPDGPDDGGDFGPNTPNTKTCGMNEAFIYAKEHEYDVYIEGGMGGPGLDRAIYHVEDTVHIPPMQNFYLDGGDYIITAPQEVFPKGKAVVLIDTQMNSNFKLGHVINGGTGTAIRVATVNPGPDQVAYGGSPTTIANFFEFTMVNSRGISIEIDPMNGSINNNAFVAGESNSFDINVHVVGYKGGAHEFGNNTIKVLFGNQYDAPREDTIGLRLGDPGADNIFWNRIEMFTGTQAQRNAGSIGADIFAQNNIITLASWGYETGVVFEPEARDNLVFCHGLHMHPREDARELASGKVVNKATIPTNRIVPLRPVGLRVDTPDVPASGERLTNRLPYTVEVFVLTVGRVDGWEIADADNERLSIVGPFYAGQTILLEPGDSVSVEYSEAPTWRWKAIR